MEVSVGANVNLHVMRHVNSSTLVFLNLPNIFAIANANPVGNQAVPIPSWCELTSTATRFCDCVSSRFVLASQAELEVYKWIDMGSRSRSRALEILTVTFQTSHSHVDLHRNVYQ